MEGADRDALILGSTEWARRTVLQFIRRRRILIPADDAIAAGYLALVEAAGRYRPGSAAKFTTFAHRRIVGAVLDLSYSLCGADRPGVGRERRYFPDPIPLGDLTAELVDPGPGPFEGAVRAWAAARVAELPPNERDVVWAVYFEAATLAEVAGRLGVSESRACQLAKAGVARVRAGLL